MTELEVVGSAVDTTVLTLAGEIDLAVAEHHRQTVRDALQGRPLALTLDLSAVTFMDSTGLDVLLYARNACQAKGVALMLGRPSMPVRRILSLSGTTALFVSDTSR
jgi:anti-anti-sigma factor